MPAKFYRAHDNALLGLKLCTMNLLHAMISWSLEKYHKIMAASKTERTLEVLLFMTLDDTINRTP